MAGTEQAENQFVWDENSQLYYHARTGFYHDPQAGWYYSCKDGLYYKFENGTYVLMESFQDDCRETNSFDGVTPAESYQDEKDVGISLSGENMAQTVEPLSTEFSKEHVEDSTGKLPENLPPPSEWLEDTLIELYLSNYSTQVTGSTSDMTMPSETTEAGHTCLSPAENDDMYELEEGEWIPDYHADSADPNANFTDEGPCLEEENWRAQYGQVERPSKDSLSHLRVVDLWDWSVVKKIRKGRKRRVTRLVGRLVKPTAKLHPSMPSSGHLLKTAPICEVHLDLVRVRSGQVYRLRNPSTRYLASLLNYDSSNPTKDWRFPQMCINRDIQTCLSVAETYKSVSTPLPGAEEVSLPSQQIDAPEQDRSNVYRDRAAERRALHGGFGVGPGQKISANSDGSVPLDTYADPEEALAESLSNSFGAGSYARRILENMGWQEGEALGCSNKGLIEPLRVTGNKGSAGLGWK